MEQGQIPKSNDRAQGSSAQKLGDGAQGHSGIMVGGGDRKSSSKGDNDQHFEMSEGLKLSENCLISFFF